MKTFIIVALLATSLNAQQWVRISKSSKHFCSNSVYFIDTTSFKHYSNKPDTIATVMVILFKEHINTDTVAVESINLNDVVSVDVSYNHGIHSYRDQPGFRPLPISTVTSYIEVQLDGGFTAFVAKGYLPEYLRKKKANK